MSVITAHLGLHRIRWFYKLIPAKESKLALVYRCRNWGPSGSSDLETGSFGFPSFHQARLWWLHSLSISSKENQTKPQTPCRQPWAGEESRAPHRSSVYSRAPPWPQNCFDHHEVSTNTEWMRKKMVMLLTWSTLMRNEAYTVFPVASRFRQLSPFPLGYRLKMFVYFVCFLTLLIT